MNIIEAQNTIRGAANFVYADEPCYYLSEINLPGKPGEGNHRYQILGVVRNDELCDCHIDMGLESAFEGVDQLRIITAIETSNGKREALHMVREAMFMADDIRGIKVDKSEWPVLDLLGLYREAEENRKRGVLCR